MAQYVPEGLEERVDFASWRQPGPEAERYQLRDPTLAGDEIAGWALQRSRSVRLPDAPPFLRTTWTRSPGATDPLLMIDVHVADAPASARALALRLLGDFQSPLVARRTDREIGEVAFGDGSPNWIVFVRGNLVVWVRNGGRQVAAVLEAAAELDAALVRRAGGGPNEPAEPPRRRRP